MSSLTVISYLDDTRIEICWIYANDLLPIPPPGFPFRITLAPSHCRGFHCRGLLLYSTYIHTYIHTYMDSTPHRTTPQHKRTRLIYVQHKYSSKWEGPFVTVSKIRGILPSCRMLQLISRLCCNNHGIQVEVVGRCCSTAVELVWISV